MNKLDFEKEISNKKIFVYIIFIMTGGFLCRYIFTPFEVPLILDSLQYFWYGIDLSTTGKFPLDYDLTNNMWPTFLSPLFSILDSTNYMDYMNLQRYVTMIFSIVTSIPIYFLAKRFVGRNIALIAPIMFIFEPRIIYNSIAGITEPMFIFCIVSTFALFFSGKKKMVMCSFILLGLSCLVRYEALVLIIPMTILLFFKFRNNKFKILYPVLAVIIFLIVITPMSIIKTETMGYDGIFSHVIGGGEVVVRDSINLDPTGQQFHPITGIEKFLRLFVWTMIPTYIIFLPLGFFYFLKNKRTEKTELIILGIFSLVPAFYAASRGIEDTRYYFIFYPLFIIFSLYFIEWIKDKWKIKYIKFACVGLILISSCIFLIIKDDSEYKSEVFHVVKQNFSEMKVINDIHPYSPYFRAMPLHVSESFPLDRDKLIEDILILPVDDFDSIEELFESEDGSKITHLIIDDSPSRKDFLRELFRDETKYPFLEKNYDSIGEGLKYHVKIFKFDPQKFINLNEEVK